MTKKVEKFILPAHDAEAVKEDVADLLDPTNTVRFGEITALPNRVSSEKFGKPGVHLAIIEQARDDMAAVFQLRGGLSHENV